MTTFNEGDHVKIKKLDVTGQIIDILKHDDGVTTHLVESDAEGYRDGPEVLVPGIWPIYECFTEDLELISET